MEDAFKKNKGNAGLEGVQFQLDLVIIFLLNALRSCTDWKISSEDEAADKYDDLVFQLPNKKMSLQAKFKQSKKITRGQLFSSNSKKTDFSLPKYFFAYLKNRSKVKDTTVIVCTNTGINPKGLKNVLTSHHAAPDSMLHCDEATCPYFTFNKNVLPVLRECAESYLEENLRGKGFDKLLITDENMEDFLRNFQFFYKYPSGDKLHQVIERSLCRLDDLWRRTTYHEIYQKVEEWFKQPKGEYLTVSRANAMLCEIRSDQYRNFLKNYQVSFKCNNFQFSNSNRIIHMKTDGGFLLQMLRIFQSLQNNKIKQLYVNPNEDIQMQKQMVEAFGLPRYVFLIMVWSKIEDKTVKLEISRKLREILEKDRYKKIVLLTKGDVDVHQLVGLMDIYQVDGCVTFQSFSKNSREVLLKMKNIVFQGERVSLEELLDTQAVEGYSKSLDSEMLEELVRGEEIAVGERVLDLDESVAQYYVHRTFEREITGKGKRREAISEENLFEVTKKIVLISDSAGMGKSTTLTKIAARIKQKYSRMWVIRTNLMDYTRMLRDSLRNGRETVTVEELMNSQEATKFKNRFEKFLFDINGKVVLLLDGVDEIAPNYTSLILHLIRHCQEATNIAKVFATTRPHLTGKLRKFLNVESFKMLPFTTRNQTEFLINYWRHNLQLDGKDESRGKCARYAKMIIRKMYSWTQSYYYEENSLGAIPLQLRMIADVFQEKGTWESNDWESCREFLKATEKEPKLPGKFEISKLYAMFIERKRDIFLEKGNPSGNTIADEGLIDQFEELLARHRSLALKVILTENYCNLFSTYEGGDHSRLFKIGIVQKNSDSLFFVHRTFAEYFVAASILQELQLNPSLEFQKFIIDEVFVRDEFVVIRGFLDNCLQKAMDSLSSNIFAKYQSHISDVNFNLIFELVNEGRVAILQLILKSIKFRVIRGKMVKPANLKMNSGDWISNTLNYLQIITREVGVNIKGLGGCTPLHHAAQIGHLEMVKFLIEHGADITIENENGRTPLLAAAAENCTLNTVKCLVKSGANVNGKDRKGCTALHLVVRRGALDAIKYIVDCGADVNDKCSEGRTALHWAASRRELAVVKYLVQCGANINDRDCGGRTALHWAANRGKVDIIKYIMKCGANVGDRDSDGRTACHLAIMKGKLDAIKYIIQSGASIKDRYGDGDTALHWAAKKGDLHTIKYIVKCGANVNDRSNDGRTALHWASEGGRLQAIKYIVESGANVNDRDGDDRTALHWAAKKGDLYTIKYLVECGANVNDRDCGGRTTLHWAANRGKVNIIKYVVKCGANVRDRDNDGRTALHWAVMKGKLDALKYIVERGANVNDRDGDGNTALHWAAIKGHLNAIKYIVKCGADVNAKDNSGRTATQLAQQFKDFTNAEYLEALNENADNMSSNRS